MLQSEDCPQHFCYFHGIYYFRAVPESWDEDIIKLIALLGHEIGYHYESLTTCNGDVDAAYKDFCTNLERLRKIVPVRSICMHGSPRSPFDSKDIWKKYDYHKLGIENEPYLDTDFSKVFYLTDTGRRWDGYKVSVRDKIPQYHLFSGAYDNRVKNASLAKAAIDLLPGVQLIELKGFKRTQVATLMQAVDALVITSFTEGSPQVIKEAMACGCPIVSVDVGDVKDLIKGIDGCYIAERNAKSIADNLSKAIAFGKRTEGRSVIIGKGLTNDIIASKLIRVYNSIIQR